MSAFRPGNFTERFTVHRNAVNGITVVSFFAILMCHCTPLCHKRWSVLQTHNKAPIW